MDKVAVKKAFTFIVTTSHVRTFTVDAENEGGWQPVP